EPPLLPPGQGLHARVALLAEADEVDHLVHVARPAVVPGEEAGRLPHGEIRPELRLLQDDADALPVLAPRACGIEAEDVDASAVALAVTLEDLDRRRLAGAVRAEQSEDLAFVDPEADAADGFMAAVRLAQFLDEDCAHSSTICTLAGGKG